MEQAALLLLLLLLRVRVRVRAACGVVALVGVCEIGRREKGAHGVSVRVWSEEECAAQ